MIKVSVRWLAALGAASAAVIAMGSWIYVDVQRELQTLAASNLRALLDSEVSALEIWIREKQLNVDRWSKDARVIGAASAINRDGLSSVAGAANGAVLTACRGVVSDALVNAIDALRQSDAADGVNLVDRSGRVLAARTREYCGLTLTPERLQQLRPVFGGQ